MVVTEADMNSQGDVESPLQSDQQEANRNNPFASLGRQSSIYSLTLDEFQHTLCDSGKNFGSMNMDEFLSSIWNAEENQVIVNSNYNSTNNNINNSGHLKSLNEASREKGIRKQPSLLRQGSLTIPSQLCRKTVDEVWSEIHKGQQRQQLQQQQSGNIDNNDNFQNTESTHRQHTFGEMTLEDFLVKAGVVREACPMPPPQASAGATQQQHKQYMYPNSNPAVPPSFVARPVMGSAGGGGGAGNVVAPYPAVGPGGGAMGDPSGYPGNGKRDNGYPPTAVCYGGRVVKGGGGYGVAPQTLGMAAPVSPSSDGLGTSENSGGQFGMEMGMLRGRKRIIDGPVEKVVERRQRRMIKNRESAARSRARKQAYTVELEAELNQLREENNHLRQALAELERRRKQQCFEELNSPFQTKAQKAKEKLRALRRNQSCPM